MHIAFICNNKDPEPWVNRLKNELPNTKIVVYPDISDYNEVEYLIVWKPQKGDIAQFPNVKCIQSLGASVDHIFNSAEIDDNIPVCKIVDSTLSTDMWEFVLALILRRLKNLDHYKDYQKEQKWAPGPYQAIKETTVSILGAGSIGKLVAEKLKDFGFKVNTWSRSKKSIDGIRSFQGQDEIKEMLSETDFLVSLLPLTEQTQGLIDDEFLKMLKKGAYLINVGRGEQVIEQDLLNALDDGHISGAALDVFHEEPLPGNHPFWGHNKIFITPHIASITNLDSAINVIVENYHRIKNGKLALYQVSKSKEY